MTRRVPLLTVASSLFALALAGLPQEPGEPSVVGVLANAVRPDDPAVEIFRKEMQQLGYVEGRDLSIEFRTAHGRIERLPGLAAERQPRSQASSRRRAMSRPSLLPVRVS